MDNSDEPKGSLPIEYTYARRTNKHMVSNYIWLALDINCSFEQFIVSEQSPVRVDVEHPVVS